MTQEYKKYKYDMGITRITIESDKKERIVPEEEKYLHLGQTSNNLKVFVRIEKPEKEEVIKSYQELRETLETRERITKMVDELYDRSYASNLPRILPKIRSGFFSRTKVLEEIFRKEREKYQPSGQERVAFVKIRDLNEEESKDPIKIEIVDIYQPKADLSVCYWLTGVKKFIHREYPESLLLGIEGRDDTKIAYKVMEDVKKALTSKKLEPPEKGELIKELVKKGVAKVREVYSDPHSLCSTEDDLYNVKVGHPTYQIKARPYLIIDPKKVSEYLSKK